MDCEKCDPLLIDELYGELDELTSAAVRRHVAGCARCASAFETLSGGKKLAGMMHEPVPDGLEMRILDAAKEAQKVVPLRSRGSRALSWAGSWAMRPQTAMAALFLLMIGSSAVFLGKGRYGSAPTMSAEQTAVIERDRSATATATAVAAAAPGSPAPPPMASAPVIANAKRSEAADMVALAEGRPSPIAPAAKAGIADEELGSAAKRGAGAGSVGAEAKQAADKDSLWSANSAYRAQNYSEATRLYDQSAKQGDLEAELGAARSVRDGTGCPSAVSRYDALAARAPGTTQATAAIFEGAKCYESFGDYDAAATRFKKLGGTPYAAQAKAEIDKMNTLVKAKGGSVTGGAAAAPKAAAPARMEAAPKKSPSVSGATE